MQGRLVVADATLTEILKQLGTLAAALVGGGIALIGGWLVDRRKLAMERMAVRQRERALLTGMFAVRNHIALRLNEYAAEGLESGLQPLRTALTYAERLMEKTPPDGEAPMIAMLEIGLKLDALLSTLDRRKTDPGLQDPVKYARVISRCVDELSSSLEQFDVIVAGDLATLDQSDIDALTSAAAKSSAQKST
jgi:hypothetical protein